MPIPIISSLLPRDRAPIVAWRRSVLVIAALASGCGPTPEGAVQGVADAFRREDRGGMNRYIDVNSVINGMAEELTSNPAEQQRALMGDTTVRDTTARDTPVRSASSGATREYVAGLLKRSAALMFGLEIEGVQSPWVDQNGKVDREKVLGAFSNLRDVKVSGDEATAKIDYTGLRGRPPKTLTLHFTKTVDVWRIERVEGVASTAE